MATTNDTVGVQTSASQATQLHSLIDAIRNTTDGRRTFFDTNSFPWVQLLEAEYPAIRAEFQRVLGAVGLLPGLEEIQVGQYSLTKDRRWKVLPLFAYGRWSARNAQRCPATARALQQIPGLQVAMFSIMQSEKELPPHHGNYCGVLRYHLGVLIPEPPQQCGIRVGDDTRYWMNGSSLIFDDTHLHYAWNRSNHDRGVLLLDFVRPLPADLAQRNNEVIAAIATSPSITGAATRWEEWENAYGSQLDALLAAAAD
jgi:aspartyl/asparaginyl beta-hydroxylase (cupin superfamily)